MDKREVVQDDEVMSIASDNIFFNIPKPQAEEATLSWRNDPLHNFSDWKLQIRVPEDSAKNADTASNDQISSTYADMTYYVHRNIVAIGERRSDYFANLLHYGIDDGNRCSSIELSSRAADSFPDLLDFLYSSKAFSIKTSNAIALLFMSQAFQVVALEVRVKSFIDKDIKLHNFGYYLSDALYFRDETIALKVIDTCEKEVMLLMNHAAPSVDLGLDKIMKVPLLSSTTKAKKHCLSIWSVLTHNTAQLEAKEHLIHMFLRRKYTR